MVQDSPSRRQDQFIVRLPDGMRERIRLAADQNNRSMNAEIVATLEEKYPKPSHWASLAKLLEARDRTLAKMGPEEIAKLQAAISELIDSFDEGPESASGASQAGWNKG